MKNSPTVQVEQNRDVLWIRLNRPKKLNALSKEMWKALSIAVDQANRLTSIFACVITGTGRAFSAGDDIAELAAIKSREEAVDLFINHVGRTIEAMLRSRKPIVALVNGLAYGGGCEILYLCDYVVASENARFAIAENKIGALPPVSSVLGAYVLGLKRTCELLSTAEPIDAKTAESYGLVNRVVPEGQLVNACDQYLKRLRHTSPTSLGMTRSLIYRPIKFEDILSGLQSLVEISQTDDFREGVQAFVQKRTPNYSSRIRGKS